MYNSEDVRKRIEKLKEQLGEIELAEKRALSVGSPVTDYPFITCPACGEIDELPYGGLLDDKNNKWTYYDSTCSSCGIDFRLGEVPESCALCQNPLQSLPEEDVNECDRHWCKKDGRSYCTPCFMQLFFDGYIDLSSDNMDIDDDKFLGFPVCTEVGNTAPYRSRLAAKGYELVGNAKEWNQAKDICMRIAGEGSRYLLLTIKDEQDGKYQYVAYRHIPDQR